MPLASQKSYHPDEGLEGNETFVSALERAGNACEDAALIFGMRGIEELSCPGSGAAGSRRTLLGNGWGGSAHGDELRLRAEKRPAVRDIERRERVYG